MRLLNKKAIADRYQVQVRWINRWVREGILPVIKFGDLVWFDPEACAEALLRKFTVQSIWDQPRTTIMEECPEREADTPEVPCAWCDECGYTVEMSVIKDGEGSRCLACNAFYEPFRIAHCEWCGDTVTGPVGDRFTPGCVRCLHYLAYTQ